MTFFQVIINKSEFFISIFFLITVMISCKQESHYVIKNHYDSGELLSEIPYDVKDSLKDGAFKEYYKNGEVKQLIFFKNDVPVDSAMQYFESGNLKFKEIRYKDTIHTNHFYEDGSIAIINNYLNTKPPIEISWTKTFSNDGKILDSLEYINMGGKSALNQKIHFDENQNVIRDSSFFYRFKISDIESSNKYQLKIDYTPSIIGAKVFMIISKDINKEHSNLNQVKADTIFMEDNTLNTENLKKPFRELKGYFYEYHAAVKNTVSADSVKMVIKEKKVFFDEIIRMTTRSPGSR